MKTQFYDAIKWLSIKMTKFQQHDLVLKLSKKMYFFNVWPFDDIKKFKFRSQQPLPTRMLIGKKKIHKF